MEKCDSQEFNGCGRQRPHALNTLSECRKGVECGLVFLTLESASSGGLVKRRCLGPAHGAAGSAGLGHVLRSCISNKFPGVAVLLAGRRGGKNNGPKDVHVLTPGTHGCPVLDGKGELGFGWHEFIIKY